MTTNGGTKRNDNAAVFTSVVLLVTFGLILTLLLINSGVAKTGEQAAALRATFAPTVVPPTIAATAVPLTSAAPAVAAVSFDPQKVAAGQDVFSTTCFACHGMNAKGIPGLGKDLIDSAFVHGLSDQELVAFIAQGRPVTDPANTTGVAMPARGGNPALTDAQLADVVIYIRSLTVQDNGAAPAQAAPVQPTAVEQGNETPFALPIDSVLGSSSDVSATEAPFALPIDSVIQPSSAESTEVAVPAAVEPTVAPSVEPTLVPTPAETEVPFALPIDSVLTPSS